MLNSIGKSMDESIELPIFDLATIITATKNFSLENMIGQGGFGPVYKVMTLYIILRTFSNWPSIYLKITIVSNSTGKPFYR